MFLIICFSVFFHSRVGGWEILSRPVGVDPPARPPPGVRGKSVATQKRSAPTPQFLEEKVRAFFFSCAASIHGLATCRFALISVSACAIFFKIYIYIIEFIYI